MLISAKADLFLRLFQHRHYVRDRLFERFAAVFIQGVSEKRKRRQHERIFRQFKEGNRRFSGAKSGAIPHNSREGWRDEFASDANCRFRRRTGGTSRKLQAADGVKASVSLCAILCGIAPSFPTQKWRKRRRDGVSGNFSDTPYLLDDLLLIFAV